jgi:hypothetical protein
MMKTGIGQRLLVGIFCLAVFCLVPASYGRGEDGKAKLSKEDRAQVNYLMTLETENEINAFLSRPVEVLAEEMLKNIEVKQEITIARSSMLKTDKCLHELLSGIPNLTKISSGNKIERVVIKLTGNTSRASIWDEWSARKLEMPTLTMTLYYDDPSLEPSEISCQGYQYH